MKGAGKANLERMGSADDMLHGIRPVKGLLGSAVDGSDCSNAGCSILRKQKSLPSRRKNVHFADGCGQALVSVYDEQEFNIHVALDQTKRELQGLKKTLSLCFPQPVAASDFKQRLDARFVCLENVVASQNSVWGTVKVKNIAYHKSVVVRYTLDAWGCFKDVEATYVPESNDGSSDRFSFAITVPEYFLVTGGVLEFCIRYETSGQEFWDSNGGENYKVECKESKTGKKMVDSVWSNPFK